MASEKGPSNYDLTLTNITSVVYQLPFGKGRRYGSNIPGYLDAVLGGWELTAINTAPPAPIAAKAMIAPCGAPDRSATPWARAS